MIWLRSIEIKVSHNVNYDVVGECEIFNRMQYVKIWRGRREERERERGRKERNERAKVKLALLNICSVWILANWKWMMEN